MRKRQIITFLLAIMMIITSVPLQVFAQGQQPKQKPKAVNYDEESLNYRRRLNDDKLPVLLARPEEGKTSGDFVEDPEQPAIYTLRTDFKAEKGEKYSVNYQPYVATVGAAATEDEQKKVNKKIDLPKMAGYDMPEGPNFIVNSYQNIVDATKFGHQTGNEENGFKYLALAEKRYNAKENTIVVKHVFQDMDDFTEFSNPDETITKVEGTKGKIIRKVTKTVNEKEFKEFDYANPESVDLTNPNVKEAFFKHENLTSLRGNTGSTLEVQALPESQRMGFEPQIDKLKTQVPEDTSDFKIEYRYNRAAYDVVFDTQDGTPLPSRTYYFNQEIPKLDTIPTKIGSEFLGWKPSHDLEGIDGTKYKKGDIIKDSNRNAIVDLGNTFYKKDKNGKFVLEDGDPVKETNQNEIKLKMPALKLGDGKTIPREKLTFTAVWKDKEKADFAIQFWAEKADHADNASVLNKYDYMGTKVYKDIDVGFQPYLQDIPVKGVPFPDLDQKRLEKIWNGDKFYGDKYLYLNKFFVYNKNLTDEQNKDSNTNVIKTVSATGKTVYNIYYDRQVYDLYFTKSNALGEKETFYPEIYVPDGEGGAKLAGGPGDPYHYTARFNQLMRGWPNDAMQTKGFDEGKQSYGWGPNYGEPHWPLHLDTPPYRLNADEFLDMANYDNWGGYVSQIDKGDGTYIDVYNDPRYKDEPYKALSFGIKQADGSMPHHMDFWMDGFKDGETIIRYDLYRSKADTSKPTYGHRYSRVQGFTPKGSTIEEANEENGRITADDIDALNDEREEKTPLPDKEYTNMFGFNTTVGQMNFIPAFFNTTDDFGDPLDGVRPFKENGYIRFKYYRNKYPLRFNTDPTKIKDDSEFKYPVEGGTLDQNKNANALETFYEFPLISLNPELDHHTEREDKEYFKEHPANFLDNPNNLHQLGLYDLLQRDKNDPTQFAKDAKGNYRVKRPEGLSDQMVFKGWAMDPAGKKMVWQNDGEKMPSHAVNLYAIWNEPDYKWKVTVDPNGGELKDIDPDNLTTEKKTIKEKEGDNEEPKPKTYPVKGYMAEAAEAGKQVFTVVQRQKLKNLPKPERYGYDFMGWEVIRYKKDNNEEYTNEQDTSYRERYNVPELYSFGTDVVSPLYLKAIWVENKRANVKVYHYYLKNDFSLDEKQYPNPEPNDLDYKRVGDYVPATGEKQDEHWILATNDELMKKLHGTYKEQIKDEKGNVISLEEHELLPEYMDYNNRVKLNNTFFQSFRVQEDKKDPTTGQITPNPENIFRFYYRPFRTRNYKVNYIDVRGKEKIDKFFTDLKLNDITGLKDDELLEANNDNKAKFKAKRAELEKILDKFKVIDKEDVTSECRHYDARNYRHIPGWKLASDPQQQLFYDVNEETNEFLGINGKGSNEIYFYYTDARVVETKEGDPLPDGYVRVTFKIDDIHKGGVFKDKDGKEVTELHYDVIKGLKSDLLPKPIIWEGGNDAQGKPKEKEANRYYITPDQGKTFKGWDNDKWLNAQTEINKNYTFTAYFDWSGMSTSSKGLVRTEAFKGVDGKWVNDFAPKIADLKAQLVWKEGNEVKPIPEDTDIKFVYKDDAGQEKVLTTDEELFDLVKEMNVEDKDQVVRVLNIVAKVIFKDGDKTKPQELPIPITVYKNRYEALNEKGDKPEYLTKAEKTEAKDGGLKEILKDNPENRYIKVTIKPNKDFDNKDNKVYYVNPNAWVDIPKIDTKGDSNFTNWSADIAAQNEESKENGFFDFEKRHKFTKDTVITPVGADDVVEQEKGKDKPDVPKTYVKVIVKTTDKATEETAFEKTFWVNPTKEVTIDVINPTGKTVAADPAKPGTVGYKMDFFNWKSEETTPRTWKEKIVGKFTAKETTIQAKYSVEFEKIKDLTPKTDTVPTPKGKTPTVEEITKKLTPPEGKTIKEVKIVKDPDVNTPGDSKVQVIVEYTDGSSVGTNDNPIEVPVKVHEPIVKSNPDGSKPKDALENYVKVIFTADEGGKLDNTLTGNFIYYVSPEVEVDLTETANAIGKIPATGYIANGGKWVNKDNKVLKGTFKDQETVFKYDFFKSKDIVEKTDQNPNKPDGYVTVIFRADANGKLEGDIIEKIYFVNPDANIKLVDNDKATAGAKKELIIPATIADNNYAFEKWVESIDYTNPIKGDREHVAKFTKNNVTLTYNAGEGTGTVPATQSTTHGGTVRLANADGLSKDNAVFKGWKIGETTYQPGQEITLNENTTAIAQWSSAKHTVKFIFENGLQFAQQEVEHGKTATNPDAPTQDGKVFMGWKENASDTDYFDFASTPIESDKTLVAQWQDPVQKINDDDTVEEQFIKVIFKQGNHGTLKGQTVYKVAKNLSFEDAIQAGLKVPEIVPNKYYKSKDAYEGWNEELKLEGQNIEFTAQYEPQADVIPVDPDVTDDETINKEKPEGMVLVVFKVPEDKAFMTGDTRFYVKKSQVVNIETPKVYPLTIDGQVNNYKFTGWDLSKIDGNGNGKYEVEYTEIGDSTATKPEIKIRNPRPNAKFIIIQELTDGAIGYLEVIRDGNINKITSTKKGKRLVFDLSTLEGKCVKANDLIRFYAEKDGLRSVEREYRVR